MASAFDQLHSRSGIDEKYIGFDNTIFSKDITKYKDFYKQYDSDKEKVLKWDDNMLVDINTSNNLLSECYIKVKIPYFQMKKKTSTVNVIPGESFINKLIYDSYTAYLIITNDKYYLIPEFIFTSWSENKIEYNTEIIKFSEIKKYFSDTIKSILTDNLDIYFLSFNGEYFSDLVPFFLTFCDEYNKYYINNLNNKINHRQLNSNILNSNNFTNYLEKKIKNELFDNFQNNNHYDNLTEFYNIISNEVKYYFTYFINKKNLVASNNDSYIAYENYNENIDETLTEYVKFNIQDNSLIIHYIINNFYSNLNNTYTFYKKFLTLNVNYNYEFILQSSDIDDINNLGGNLIINYYPVYTFKLNTDPNSDFFNKPIIFERLPFELSTDMEFKTLNNKSGRLDINDNTIYKLTFIDENDYDETTLTILITTDNTKNIANTEVIIDDNNLNDEFNNNLLTNLDRLNYNGELNNVIFNNFKSKYYPIEQFIKTDLKNISLKNEQLKDIFIGLKIYKNRFEKTNLDINFIDGEVENYENQFVTIKEQYSDYYNINNQPQDIYNVYLLCLKDFIDIVRLSSFFSNVEFIKIFHNKIITFFYNRFINISSLDNSIINNFNGLLYYYNIDLKYYIDKEIIKNKLKELFNRRSMIGYTSIDSKTLFSHNLIKENVNVFYDNNLLVENNQSNCFNDLMIKTTYYFNNIDDIIFSGVKLKIPKTNFNYYYFKDNFTKFNIYFITSDLNISILSYNVDDTHLILTLPYVIDSQYFYLYEFTTSVIPLVNLSTVSSVLQTNNDYEQNNLPMNNYYTSDTSLTGNINDNNRYELYNINSDINMFINESKIYFNEDYNSEYKYYLVFKNKSFNKTTFYLRYILNTTFDSISYPYLINTTLPVLLSDEIPSKLNISKDKLTFLNLIVGDGDKRNIDFYFSIDDNIEIDYIKTQITSSIDVKYYNNSSNAISSITLNNVINVLDNINHSEIKLVKDNEGYIINDTDNNKININLNSYNEVYLDVVKIKIEKNISITNSDCVYPIENTFPYIYLDKTSSVYITNSSNLTKLNTIKISNSKIPIKIVEDTISHLKMYIFSDTSISNLSIDLVINSYLPNFYNYTSNSDTTNISVLGDFMFQNPILFKMYNKSSDIPIYIFYNIIDNSNLTFYQNSDVYLNDNIVSNIDDIYSNQLNRSSTELISTIFDQNNLVILNNNIETSLLSSFDDSFNDYKKQFINIIEKSQNKFFEAHVNVLNILNNTNNFGITSQNIYKNCINLNSFTTKKKFNYNLDFINYTNIEYDYLSPFCISLYTHRFNNKLLNNDKKTIINLNSKYETTKIITMYPWINFKPSIKINEKVNTYLINYNIFIKNQIEYCNNNNNIDLLVNNDLSTESIGILSELSLRDILLNNIYNFENQTIEYLNNDFYFDDIENDNTEDIYIDTIYNNNKITVKKDGNNYKTSDKLKLYDNSNHFVETDLNYNSKFKNIGYIKIKNNNIIFDNVFDDDYEYVVVNDKIYNLPINNKKYKYYVNGKNTYGSTKGISGIFYPLSLINYGNDHLHRFEEHPGIDFYMPNTSIFHKHNSNEIPSGYFDYSKLNNYNDNIDGLYGNIKSLIKTLTYEDLSLTLFKTFYYKKIKSIEFDNFVLYSDIFDQDTNYFMLINNITCYGYYDGNYLNILSINDFIITQNLSIFYIETNLSNNNIFNKLLNNNSINFKNFYNFNIEEFTIINNENYNYYCNENTNFLSYSDYILISDDNNEINNYPQNYKKYINILGKILFKIEKNTTQLNIKSYKCNSALLPPIKIISDKDKFIQINTYNFNEEIDFFKNKGYLYFNGNSYDITDINNLSISNGNYLSYYIKSDNIPDKDVYCDLYENKNIYNNSIVFDQFNKKLTTSNINIDKNSIIEINNKKYSIKEIKLELPNNEIYLDYNKSNILHLTIKDNTNIYYRPLIFSTTQSHYNYDFYDINLTNKTDNFIIINTSNISINKVLIGKIKFNSSHLSETITLLSNNNNIEIIKESSLIFKINILNSNSLDQNEPFICNTRISVNDTEYIENIILRYIISDTYFNSNLLFDSGYLNEPIFIQSNQKYLNIESSGFTFNYFDSFYFTKSNNTTLLTNSNVTYTTFNIYDNKLNNFNDIEENSEKIIYSNNFKEHIGEFNYWEYIDNLNIEIIGNNNKLLNDTLKNYFISNYLYIILINNDKVYFREVINKNNELILSSGISGNNADLYLYPHTPIFINENINVKLINDTYYVYIDNYSNYKLERNEIIKIGNNVLFIKKYSHYNQAFIASSIGDNYTDISNNGYYSFGKINNFYEKNNILNNENIDKIFRLSNSNYILYGDYYIYNNLLNIYTGGSINNKVYLLNNGNHVTFLYDGNYLYFDPQKIKLSVGMKMYNNDTQFTITSVDKNKILFSTLGTLSFSTNDLVTFYIPINIFETTSINISDNNVQEIKNGFVLINDAYYTISNNYINYNSNLSGNYYVYNIDNIDIKYDFNNPFIITNPNYTINNSFIPVQLKMNIDTTSDIYFYNNDFSEIDFNYCYFQNIIIEGICFNVTKIQDNKIYINNKLSNFPLIIKSIYNVIISANNINNTNITSNRYKLSNNHTLNYPDFDNDNSNINILFYNNDKKRNYTISYSENNLSNVRFENKNIFLSKSNDLDDIKNINDIWDNLNKQFYINNYIKVDNITYNNDLYSTYIRVKNLDLDDLSNVLIEEIKENNDRYLHYVNLEINNNFLKILNDYKFEDINKSRFYISKIIPIRITGNKYIQILNPKLIKTREINTIDNNILYRVYFKFNFIGKPILNKKWKYRISIVSNKIDFKYIDNVYFMSNEKKIKFTTKIENNITYIIGDYLFKENDVISHLFYEINNYISKVDYNEFIFNEEYSERLSKSKLQNILKDYDKSLNKYKYLNNIQIIDKNDLYFLSIKNNNNNNINIGHIEGDYFINNTNKINYFEKKNDNSYQILLDEELYDIEKNDIFGVGNNDIDYSLYYQSNLVDNYRLEKKELSPSLKFFIDILNDTPINFNIIINSLKNWDEISFLSFYNDENLDSNIYNNVINYNGSSFSYSILSISYFTKSEKTYIENFMKNTYKYKSHYYDTISELHDLEEFILLQLKKLVKTNYFWNNIDIVINNIVTNYSSTNKWIFYNNTIMLNNNKKEIDLYPDLFENGKRKYYLSKDIFINNYTTFISVYRNINDINTDINNFITGNDSNLNKISMDDVISKLKILYKQRLNGNNVNELKNFLNQKYANIFKLLINKNFNQFIDNNDRGLNNLNNDFYNIEYTPNINSLNSGYYIDSLFDEGYFGFGSHKKISINNFDNDTYFTELISNKNIYNKTSLFPNKLNYSPLFNYEINFNDNSSKLIKSDNNYSIMFDNLEIINNPTILSNNIIFKSQNLIRDQEVIVNSQEMYEIKDFKNFGSLYEIVTNRNSNITNNSELYFNNYNKVKLLKINLSNIKIVSNVPIDNLYNLRIIDLVKIKSSSTSNKTNIIFDNSIRNLFIKDITYIEINNELYLLKYIENTYYIDNIVNIKKNRLYKITRNLDLTNVEVKTTFISDIILNKNIDDYLYSNYNNSNQNFNQNFTYDKIAIDKTEIINLNKIRVYHQYNNISIGDNIFHNYVLRQSKYYNVETITKLNKFYYNIDLNLNGKKKENLTIKIGDYIVNIEEIKQNSIVFSLSTYIDIIDLNKLTLEIKYIYNINDYTLINNKLTTSIPTDFFYLSDYNYKVNNNNVLIEVDSNLNIIFNNSFITSNVINLYEIGTFVSGKFKISKDEFNSEYRVELSNKYNPQNKTEQFIPYLSIFNENIEGGIFNYLYYFNFTIISNSINLGKYIYINSVDQIIKSRIIMIQKTNDTYNVKIGLDKLIDISNRIEIFTEDYSFNDTVLFSSSNNNNIDMKYVKNIDNNTIDVLIKNNIDEYDIDKNITLNDYMYYVKYSDITIINKSYNNVGFNKYPILNTEQIIETTLVEDVNFIDDIALHFFKNIEFLINNKTVEKFNSDGLNVLFSYYKDIYKIRDLNKIIQIKKLDDYYVFDLILPLFFTERVGNYLPLYLLNNSNIKLLLQSNSLKKLINKDQYNNYVITKNVDPIIEFNYAFINQRNLIKKNYLLIETIYDYKTIFIEKIIENNTLNLSSRIKEIYIVLKNKVNITTYDYDNWYQKYLDDYNKYSQLNSKDKNIYDIEDYYIFQLINDEIINTSQRYNIIKNHPLLSKYDPHYVLYLDEKYLNYINENLNNITNLYSEKITILSLYFSNIYKNNKIVKTKNILKNIYFELNGKLVTPILNKEVYEQLKPFYHGNKIKDNYLLFNLSLNSLIEQPNGFINFNKLDSFSINTILNTTNIDEPLEMKIILKEYKTINFQ